MLISCAILSRVAAVGVGFLLNSTSKVTSWSWVARWRFWFFCCWVRVLFLGGRRTAELCVGVLAVAAGDGVAAGTTAGIVSSGTCISKVLGGQGRKVACPTCRIREEMVDQAVRL